MKCFNCFGNMEVKGKKLKHYPFKTYIYKYICPDCKTEIWK